MAELTRDDILKLATLARLNLTDEEVESYRTELSAILDYVRQIDEVDSKDLEPTIQVTGLKNVMRADEVVDYRVTADELLKRVPRTQGRYIKVNRIIL
jgi:aspartyl-tRNA(Asn)/glutamyl-tRNA(Gln) amidotransferase subunit C